MKTKIFVYSVLVIISLFVSVDLMAQFNRNEIPVMSFKTTSTMQMSGSSYASMPALNADGSAYVPYSPASSASPSGPRRASAFDDEDEDMPIGDGTWILAFFALSYAIWRGVRGRIITKKMT